MTWSSGEPPYRGHTKKSNSPRLNRSPTIPRPQTPTRLQTGLAVVQSGEQVPFDGEIFSPRKD